MLIISPEAWGTNFVSKHHFALVLSKNNQVFFLNPPSKFCQIIKINSSLSVIDHQPRFRGLGKLPSILSAYLTKIELKGLEKKINANFDITWNFDSSRFFNMAAIKNKLKVVHLVDLNENFQRPLLCKTSDICLCTSEAIAKEMRLFNSRTFNIGHGVQEEDLTVTLTSEEKLEFKKDFEFKAAYIGNLTIKYLDWKTLYTTAQQNKTVAFYFIGPLGSSNLAKSSDIDPFLNDTQLLPNTFFLGPKLSNKILAYLKEMDVLLMAYKADVYKEQLSNPHKTLEYLASGKVVVASWTDEYKDKIELIEMVNNNKSFPKKFTEVISNLEHFNSPEKQLLRKTFAQQNIYDKKVKQISDLLDSTLWKGPQKVTK